MIHNTRRKLGNTIRGKTWNQRNDVPEWVAIRVSVSIERFCVEAGFVGESEVGDRPCGVPLNSRLDPSNGFGLPEGWANTTSMTAT